MYCIKEHVKPDHPENIHYDWHSPIFMSEKPWNSFSKNCQYDKYNHSDKDDKD